jgi:hypothetical protein
MEHLSPDIRICGSKEDGVYPNVFIASQVTGDTKKVIQKYLILVDLCFLAVASRFWSKPIVRYL